MSKVYSVAPSGLAERVAHIMQCFHKPLHDAGVKIDLLSVADDDPEVADALKLRGHPAYAIVRILDIKQRTKGHGDAEIIFDEAKWLTLPDATKDAICDHEINHLELQISAKTKRVKLDCCGRPKLKMRLHDVEIGHFLCIAERHGVASIEVKQCTQLYMEHRQTLFAFALDADLRKRLDAATDESSGDTSPSPKVKALAKEIMEASPALREAAKNLVSHLREHNATMSISSGGQTTEIK